MHAYNVCICLCVHVFMRVCSYCGTTYTTYCSCTYTYAMYVSTLLLWMYGCVLLPVMRAVRGINLSATYCTCKLEQKKCMYVCMYACMYVRYMTRKT